MDWKQILSLSNENLTDERKEEIYNELIKDQTFDSKIAKKLFPLCLSILKFKGQQVEKQRDEIEMLASSDIDLKSTLEQMEKQKKMLSKYEAERLQFKARIKELSEEIALMHGRELQGSDEDSPDQLSEIDKQEDLMAKISAKNKHIKRLLRDIEKHEHEAASYLNVIKTMKMNLEQANEKILQLETQLADSIESNAFIEKKLVDVSNQLLELEQENKQLVKDSDEKEKEIQIFSTQIQERCMVYKGILDEKQREIDMMKERYEMLIEQVPGIDIDVVEIENKKLIDLSKEKDELIKVYNNEIQALSAKLIDSTETIKNLIDERNELREKLSINKSDKCCEETIILLERSNERNMELQEMLEKADEDNILKSKQAFEALEMLKSYENSSDCLADALKKIHQLQETVHQRDKQIQEFVVEINAQNEVVAENSVLRRRLGISDDEIVETKAFLAKQKRYAKINDRLMLKLRASEEMRLQLKLDKHDLKRKISELELRLNGQDYKKTKKEEDLNQSRTTSECSEAYKFKSTGEKESHRVEMKQCENCQVSYNVYDSLKYCRNCIMSQNLCENCTANLKMMSNENIELIKKIAKLEVDHQSIVEENENLRSGLNEILEKLRDYEGSTNKTIVNQALLEKLLYILKLRANLKGSEHETDPNEILTTNISSNQHHEENSDIHNEISNLKYLIKKLSEENDAIKLDLEKMNELQKLYEELVRSSELSDDNKQQLLVKSIERCHEFENNLKSYERKIGFLLNENDILHREIKILKVSSLELMNDMKMNFLSKSEQMIEIDTQDDENNEILILEDEIEKLRLELNCLCFNVLKNIKSLDSENLLESIDKDQLSNVAVIENDLTTTFITRIELKSLKSKLAKMQETIKAHEIREKQLEEIVKVAQHQLKSQQLMLSKISEDEVVARHLIVDLQSQSNDNYLLTKTTRDLTIAKTNEDYAKLENDKLKSDIIILEEKLLKAQQTLDEKKREWSERESENVLKIQYLKKSLVDLCNNYSTMTPIYLIADFIKQYSALLEAKKQFELSKMSSKLMLEISNESLLAQSKEMSLTDIEAKIEIIKYRSSCDYLQQQLTTYESKIGELYNEITRIKTNDIKTAQHWNAIRMLFDASKENSNDIININVDEKMKFDKEIQVNVIKRDYGTNTDMDLQQHQQVQQTTLVSIVTEHKEQAQFSHSISDQTQVQEIDDQNSLEIQLKKALSLASSRSSLLIETENRLSEAHGRIKVLEKSLENQRTLVNEKKQIHLPLDENVKKDDHIMNITISTLQNLIVDKDANISRYQEILKAERQQNMRIFDENSEQIKKLKKVIDSHEYIIEERNKSIEKLKAELKELKEKLDDVSKSESPVTSHEILSSKRNELNDMEMKLKDAHTEIKKMEQQIKDLTNTERLLQNVIHEKDLAVKELNIKLKASNDNLETLSENFTSAPPEIDTLREMLEEKDKHIQDLTETLNQFHDDQQKYITDAAFNSAEQATIMSTNLTRSEAKIRVLETQVEAMKRQVANLQQREKNSRDLVKTLKNQLIRRPVISIKSDKRSMTPREEQQQKKIIQLENELLETKDELRRQININDNKKAKNAAELGLWDKLKRYQEISEKLKAKLTEKEIDVERMKANLQMARNTAKRLENEKIMIENKLKSGKYLQKFQQSAPCLNCSGKNRDSSSVVSDVTECSRNQSDTSAEIITTLKSRVEVLQRRIIAMELEKKGPSVAAAEYEKLFEKLSKTEAKVMRLESANAQLQLEIDLMMQNNQEKNQENKLKYLEDYILILKEELTQARLASSSTATKSKSNEDSASKIHDMEQTILNLKLIVEKLHAENKYLRSAKNRANINSKEPYLTQSYMSASDRKKEEVFEKLKTEYEKLQKNYNELLKQNSRLKIDLELLKVQNQTISASCPHCDQKNLDELAAHDVETLREKLQQRDMVIEKAKYLVTQSCAKERQLRETIARLKKKICELEGVPVISEENSESGVS